MAGRPIHLSSGPTVRLVCFEPFSPRDAFGRWRWRRALRSAQGVQKFYVFVPPCLSFDSAKTRLKLREVGAVKKASGTAFGESPLSEGETRKVASSSSCAYYPCTPSSSSSGYTLACPSVAPSPISCSTQLAANTNMQCQ